MRNGIYSDYKGQTLEVKTLKDQDDKLILIFKESFCPFPEFEKSNFEEEGYFLIIDLKDLQEAYEVKTYGIYKGYKFRVFKLNIIGEQELLRIISYEKDAFENLELLEINHGCYGEDIYIADLERVWEERISAFGLPMPKDVSKLKEIKIS